MPGIFEDTTCTLHIQLPPQRNYAQKKYESDSDEEIATEPSLTNIKKEEVNDIEATTTTTTDATITAMDVTTTAMDATTTATDATIAAIC